MTRNSTFSCMLSMLAAALLLVGPAFADTLNLSLSSAVGYGDPGSSTSFIATVDAPLTNSGTIYLNSDSFNIGGNLFLDDSAFLTNFPLNMDPGTSYTGVLFTVDPEPSTFLLLGSGLLAVAGSVRRRLTT